MGKSSDSGQIKPKVGLVLGGEGIKSFCALPMIEYFIKTKMEVDLVVGVSGGAFMAALWGAGYNLRQIQKIFAKAVDRKFYNQVDYKTLLRLANASSEKFDMSSGLYKSTGLKKIYDKLFSQMDLKDLKFPTSIMATDLRKGQSVVLDHGPLADIVYSSGAIYPLMPPGSVDGKLLVDGSLFSPLPIMEAVKQGMDVIIAVYFSDAYNDEPDGFWESFFNVSKIYKKSLLQSQIPLSIDMHNYEIIPIEIRHPSSLELWEVERLPEILHAGRLAVADNAQRIEGIINEFSRAKTIAEGKRRQVSQPQFPSLNKEDIAEVEDARPKVSTTIKYE